MLRRAVQPSPLGAERIPLWQTLGGRLTTILFFALMPVLAFSLAEAAREIINSNVERRVQLERQADILTGEFNNIFGAAFQVMTLLRRQPEVANPSDPRCQGTLADAAAAFPDFANITIADPQGHVICRDHPPLNTMSVAQFDWFKQAQAHPAPLIAGPMPSLTDGRPVVVVAEPLAFGAGTGVIFVSLDRASLDRLSYVAEIARGTQIFLVDRRNQVLIGPEAAKTPGILPSATDMEGGAAKPGEAFRASGSNGRTYLYVVNPIHGGDVLGLLVRPTDTFDMARLAAIIGQIALPVLLTALALFIVWLATDRIIVHWVRHLRAVAISYRRGNMNVRTRNMENAPRELAQLGVTLDQMAEAIVDREARLFEHLKQRETLLREVNHRVKNNVQVITSLLNLQVRAVDTEPERLLVRDIQARIEALALVYRIAYSSQNVELINVRDLLPMLVEQVAYYFNSEHQNIEVVTNCDEAHLTIDEAIPFAQLVTEALSNSMRHAFTGRTTGKIQVTLSCESQTSAKISISDDGIGLPADLAQRPAHKRTGQSLIIAFAKQIGGTAVVNSNDGTNVVVHFPYRKLAQEAAYQSPAKNLSTLTETA